MSGVDDQRQSDAAEMTAELDFLRFFFTEAGYAFGPADHDVYCGIMENYEDNGARVPDTYRLGYLTPYPEDE